MLPMLARGRTSWCALAVLAALAAAPAEARDAGPDAASASVTDAGQDAAPAPVTDAGQDAAPAPVTDAGQVSGADLDAGSVTGAAAAAGAGAVRPTRPPSGWQVIKAIIGLLVILVLAYLVGHPAVIEFERALRLTQVITAGFLFVLLGLIARQPSVGILSPDVLREIRPFLPFGLGWIGFAIGFRFDVRRLDLDDLPRGVGAAVLLTAMLPFAGIVAVSSVILVLSRGIEDTIFLRNAVILGAAGVVGVRAASSALGDRLALIVQLQEGCAIVALVLLAAFWRPTGAASWQLPAIAWVFLTLGLGLTLAIVLYAVLSTFRTQNELMVLLLGSICLSAGLASYLRLSPIAVCFITAALLFNLPGDFKQQVRLVLARLERPIYLVFLTLAGALWQVSDWRGWALLPLFVVARLFGKWLGMWVWKQRALGEMSNEEQSRLALAPMGALAIAVVVNAQDLYSGPAVAWMVTTVIGGAVVTEIVVQLLARSGRAATAEADQPMPSLMTRPPTRPLMVPDDLEGSAPEGDER